MHPYIAIILAVTFGAFNGVLLKWLELPPTVIAFFRMAVPTVVLFAFLKICKKRKLLRGKHGMLIVASGLHALRMFLYFLAFAFTTVANGVIVLYTWPIFTTLFGVFLLKEKIRRSEAMLMGVAFIGVVIMNIGEELSFSNQDVLGMLMMLASAAIYSLTVIIFKTRLTQYSNHEIIFYQNLVGAFVFLPFIFKHAALLTISNSLIAVGHYGLLVGIGSFTLIFYALRKLDMLRFSLLHYWEILAGVLFGLILLNEQIGWNSILGGILIIASGAILIRYRNKRIIVAV